MPDQERKKLLKDTRSDILTLNDRRVMFAHNTFSADDTGGLRFRRVVANTKLEVSTVPLTSKDVEQLCVQAETLSRQLDRLVTEMRPYNSSLDFSNPRNSGNLAVIL